MKFILAVVLLLALVLQASASSHSEAPGTAKKPSSDITDFYMFRSPENPDNLILMMGILGLQSPNAGPNWYTFSDQHFFEFHLVCDAVSVSSAHVFQFYFGSRFNGQGAPIAYPNDYDYSQCNYGQPAATTPSVALSIGQGADARLVEIPLKVYDTIYNPQKWTGPSFPNNINRDAINWIETYHINYFQNVPAPAGSNNFGTPTVVTHGSSDDTFRVPFTYVGDKTFGSADNYDDYADTFIYTTNPFLTCPTGGARSARVFAGPREDPFFIDLGRTFDLLNFNPPIIGDTDGTILNCDENNDIVHSNTNYIVLEVPKCAVECPGVSPNVLGAWTAVRELLHDSTDQHIPGAITNRFGQPLINELIIGIGDKQLWNYDHPVNEADFGVYYRYPTVPAVIQSLFGVGAPTVKQGGRDDLYELLLRGIPNLNRVATQNDIAVTVTPSDLLRINLDSSSITTNPSTANIIGVIGGDAAGYPNGRRVYDDVVDITLRAAMGALCDNKFENGFGCNQTQAPVYNVPFGDGVGSSAAHFRQSFPFLNTPNPGAVANSNPRECSAAGTLTFALMTILASLFAFFF